jgi:hypothetical protein
MFRAWRIFFIAVSVLLCPSTLWAQTVDVSAALDPLAAVGKVARNLMCLTPQRFYLKDNIISISESDISRAIKEVLPQHDSDAVPMYSVKLSRIDARLCYKSDGFAKLYMATPSNPTGSVSVTFIWSRSDNAALTKTLISTSAQRQDKSLTAQMLFLEAVRENARLFLQNAQPVPTAHR